MAVLLLQPSFFTPTAVKVFVLLKKHFLYSHKLKKRALFAVEKSSFSAAYVMDASYTPTFIKENFSTSFLYTFMYLFYSHPLNKIPAGHTHLLNLGR